MHQENKPALSPSKTTLETKKSDANPLSVRCTVVGSIDEVSADQWNQLEGTHIPFLNHRFLSALERHHCVGERTGWIPQHLLLFAEDNQEDSAFQERSGKDRRIQCREFPDRRTQQDRLVGAIPLYLKTNSYGELVFDMTWAEAYHRSGLSYYPKLVTAIPYTPATGPRLLIAPDVDHGHIANELVQHAIEHAKNCKVSSLHFLFPHEQDLQILSENGLLPRLGCQFHWHNENYRDFDDYLDKFTSAKRKKIRRERRQVTESGVQIQRLYADQLSDEQWRAVHRHYSSTYDRLGGYATLSLDFFQEISRTMPQQLIIMLAQHQGQNVASAICFRDDHTLYGRHWGCDAHYQNLHFEACYYQGLEYCIEQKLQRFDPGAQGEHKISRGFLPTATWSAHWIADPKFQVAIDDFLQRETRGMRKYIEDLGASSPFKKN